MKTKTEYVIQIMLTSGLVDKAGKAVERWYDTKHNYRRKSSAMWCFRMIKAKKARWVPDEPIRVMKRTEEILG